MAEPQSDADKIRMKRLAKLGGQSASAGESSTSGRTTPSAQSSTGTPKTDNVTPAPVSTSEPASVPKTNPFSQLGLGSSEKPPPRITITPNTTGVNKPKPSQDGRDSPEVWEDKTLSNIFKITLNSETQKDIQGHPVHFVGGVKADLEEEGKPLRLATAILDQALLEAASNLPGGNILNYFLGCWKRVTRMFRGMHAGQRTDERYGVLKEARRLCMSYCIFAVTMPEMFGQDTPPVPALAEHLLLDPDSDRGICHDFLVEAVSRFDEDESIKEALVNAMEYLSQKLSTISMNDGYKPYITALRSFAQYKPLLVALTQSPSFLPPSLEPQDIEIKSFLGPFFRLSPMQGEVAVNYFSSPRTRDKAYIINAQKALRMSLQTHQDELFDIANAFIKAKDAREKMLDWFALTVNVNHKRRALQVDPNTVSSDGFMVNITVILDRLCEPFMDATFSKIDRIDPDYLRRNPRVDIREETKINADQATSDRFYAEQVDGTSNFISEVFFLTVAAHHYGTEAANSGLSALQKDVKWLEKQLEKFEQERHKFINNPVQLAMFERHLKQLKDRLEKGHCTILSVQGVLMDEVMQGRSMLFMRYVIVWLLRLVSPDQSYPQKPLQLPLPEEQPDVFKCLPEYFLEDVVGNFKFLTKNLYTAINSTQCEEIMMICITFLRNSEYIKNPYLKSGLVTIMFHGVWPVPYRNRGVLGDILFGSPFANKHLLHALMKFYIEAESTGRNTQFYDKFNIRYEIFQVIKCIWGNPVYRENLATEASVNLDFFVRFVNLLLNDVTFVLDESFTAFAQIHDITKLLNDPNQSLEEAVRQEKEEALAAAVNKAKNYMNLTNETVAMLKLFTEALADSFTMPEIVQRLADMLGYNLDALVGPKSSNLRVDKPSELGWNPRQMLSEITDVYLNLRNKPNFQAAVAKDGRSYKPSNFTKAHDILKKYALKDEITLAAWDTLAVKVQAAKEADEQEEEDYGEIPDEFLDPLMFTLMQDPVILPMSRVTIDRSTIRSHLLSDPNDPFNRAPLEIEDVIPDTELKAKIEAFKAEKKSRRLAAGDPMDTSTG